MMKGTSRVRRDSATATVDHGDRRGSGDHTARCTLKKACLGNVASDAQLAGVPVSLEERHFNLCALCCTGFTARLRKLGT